VSCFKNSCMQLHSVAVREQICSLARFFFLRSDFCELAASQVVLYCPERDSEITTGARQIFEFLLTQSLRQTLVGGTHTWHGLAEGPSSSNLRVPRSCELGASGQARWQHPHPQLAACTRTCCATQGGWGAKGVDPVQTNRITLLLVCGCASLRPTRCWALWHGDPAEGELAALHTVAVG